MEEFVLSINTEEFLYPPSNVNLYYEDVFQILCKEFRWNTYIEDMLQDIAHYCLMSGQQFESRDHVYGFFRMSVVNKIRNARKQRKDYIPLDSEELDEYQSDPYIDWPMFEEDDDTWIIEVVGRWYYLRGTILLNLTPRQVLDEWKEEREKGKRI